MEIIIENFICCILIEGDAAIDIIGKKLCEVHFFADQLLIDTECIIDMIASELPRSASLEIKVLKLIELAIFSMERFKKHLVKSCALICMHPQAFERSYH